jgi:hypothetical protein
MHTCALDTYEQGANERKQPQKADFASECVLVDISLLTCIHTCIHVNMCDT